MMICVPVRQDANLCSTTGKGIRLASAVSLEDALRYMARRSCIIGGQLALAPYGSLQPYH